MRVISAAMCLVATSGGTMAQNLTCTLTAGDPVVSQKLCDAVAARLSDRADGHFDLVITTAHQQHLQARLCLTIGHTRQDGPDLTVSIVDRATLPDHIISRFAASLVASIAQP